MTNNLTNVIHSKRKRILAIISIVFLILLFLSAFIPYISVHNKQSEDIIAKMNFCERLRYNAKCMLCKHENSEDYIDISPTCTSEGHAEIRCSKCSLILGEHSIKKLDHNYNATVTPPTCVSEGYTTYTCSECGISYVDNKKEMLPHQIEEVVTEATCQKAGKIEKICSVCGTVIETKEIPVLDHNYEFVDYKYAIPGKSGWRKERCSMCGDEKTTATRFSPKGSYNLYIPSIGMNAEVTPADYTQRSVDAYDIVVNDRKINANNPVILGHARKSLGKIVKLSVGDIIYYTTPKGTKTYKVIISEPGIDETKYKIVGMWTGTSLLETICDSALHLFTCYHAGGADRWMVIATEI